MSPTTDATPETVEIRPQAGPQETFLSSSADIAIYGGSAGGGKSWSLLLEPLRHVANPNFGGVIFRRTSPQITNEGGLWDEAEKLYPLAGAKGMVGSLDWRFPSGANVSMRHLQHESNKYDWQGSQIAFLGFDELTHFTESQVFYLLSRNRSTCGVRPYVRATTNPDAGSWVKRFIAPWVDRGHPEPARSGELRHFVRVDGQITWVPAGTPDSKSVTFVRASVYDNRILLRLNPEYLATLKSLPPVERARLLDGDWDVKRDGVVYPGLIDCVYEPSSLAALPEGQAVGGMDFGFNHPFAALGAILDRDDVLWIHWERYRSGCTLPTHSEALPKGPRWWADPARPDSIVELRLAGHDVIPCVHQGKRPILEGIDRVSERIRTGRLKVSRDCQDLIRESQLYRYDPERPSELPVDADNHAADALRYLITGLDRGQAVLGRPKPATPEEVEAERLAAIEAAAKRRAEHLSIDNDDWWEGR
jgi:hypothetical protein